MYELLSNYDEAVNPSRSLCGWVDAHCAAMICDEVLVGCAV